MTWGALRWHTTFCGICLDACKVTHLLRSADLSGCDDILATISETTRSCLSNVVGGELSPLAWRQARLPVKSCGMGISCAVLTLPAARISAISSYLAKATETVGIPHEVVYPPTDSASIVHQMALNVGVQMEPLIEWSQQGVKATSCSQHASQRWWMDHVFKKEVRTLRTESTARGQGTSTVPLAAIHRRVDEPCSLSRLGLPDDQHGVSVCSPVAPRPPHSGQRP